MSWIPCLVHPVKGSLLWRHDRRQHHAHGPLLLRLQHRSRLWSPLRRFYHDKVAEAAYLAVHHNSSVAELLISQGYGPDNPVVDAAVEKGGWQKCDHCDYKGAPASIRNHMTKVQKAEKSQRESLEKSLRALGGTWDPSRGMQTLRDSKLPPVREVHPGRLPQTGRRRAAGENRREQGHLLRHRAVRTGWVSTPNR